MDIGNFFHLALFWYFFFISRDLLVNFLLDTNIFGIDVDRDPYNADQTTLIQLYQPNLFLPPGGFNFTVPETVQALQLYNTYITEVRNKKEKFVKLV